MSVLKGLRQSLGAVWRCDQVHMIGHQTVAEHGKRSESRMFAKQGQIREAIGGGVEDDLPRIATLGDVMSNAHDHDTGKPGHARKITKCAQNRAALRLVWLQSW